MAKTIILLNLEQDTKELGSVDGRRIVLGSKLDEAIVAPNIARPTVELTQKEYDTLRESPAIEQSLDYWIKSNKVIKRVEG